MTRLPRDTAAQTHGHGCSETQTCIEKSISRDTDADTDLRQHDTAAKTHRHKCRHGCSKTRTCFWEIEITRHGHGCSKRHTAALREIKITRRRGPSSHRQNSYLDPTVWLGDLYFFSQPSIYFKERQQCSSVPSKTLFQNRPWVFKKLNRAWHLPDIHACM